jgi:ABC-type multidrug transport system ATPase subunit
MNSVETEKKRVIENEENGVYAEGLRIVNIHKVYNKLPFGLKSKKDVHAVKGIYLEMQKNELLCLLGHNGAGKSTLFNMMTGIIAPSSGDAKICGLDVKDNQDRIRKVMGVVPQFDILWNKLTAFEHMRMFSKIKGVPNHEIEGQSDELLKTVNLYDVKHAQVESFSGGMKRRLSVAISAIGNPRIIFFDEPTTGMDPVSRHNVWQLMQSLKKDKTIVLTTHAMEEADILADRIAVVADGELRCVGSPLNLKNTYGDGYRISLVLGQQGLENKVI